MPFCSIIKSKLKFKLMYRPPFTQKIVFLLSYIEKVLPPDFCPGMSKGIQAKTIEIIHGSSYACLYISAQSSNPV